MGKASLKLLCELDSVIVERPRCLGVSIGTILTRQSTTFYAPKLISVGGDLITQYAEDFYPINIKVAGEWKMNPEARTLRLEKHAREILRQGETLEI